LLVSGYTLTGRAGVGAAAIVPLGARVIAVDRENVADAVKEKIGCAPFSATARWVFRPAIRRGFATFLRRTEWRAAPAP